MTFEEIKTIGLVVSEAVVDGRDPTALLDGLDRFELYDLIVATNQVLIEALSKRIEFKTWLDEVVEGAAEIAPTSPTVAVLFAVQVAADMVLS